MYLIALNTRAFRSYPLTQRVEVTPILETIIAGP